MRAIIDATGVRPPRHDLFLESNPTPLLPVAGKAMIVHVVEALVRRGAKRLDVIMADGADRMEELLEDGRRWGVPITPRLAKGPEEAWQHIELVAKDHGDEPIWLARGDRLPAAITAAEGDGEEEDLRCGTFYYDGDGNWTGWAFLEAGRLSGIAKVRRIQDAEDHLSGGREDRSVIGADLSCWPLSRYLDANVQVASGRWTALLLDLRQVEAGIWIGRNVQIHPRARVEGPVFLDDDVSIGEEAHVGPGAVLGKGCIVEGGGSVREAVVLPHTYVGPGLALERAVADRTLLAHVDLATTLVMDDPVLLGDLRDKSLRRALAHVAERGVAAIVFVATLPLLALTTLLLRLWRRGPALVRSRIVRLPASPMTACWRSFDLDSFGVAAVPPERRNPVERFIARFGLDALPALRQIVSGSLHFVGLRPRSREELEALPREWRSQVLQSRVGLLSLAQALHGPRPDEDELFASEVWYAQCRSLRQDLDVIRRWLFPRRRSFRATC